jgi:hypothetical protein
MVLHFLSSSLSSAHSFIQFQLKLIWILFWSEKKKQVSSRISFPTFWKSVTGFFIFVKVQLHCVTCVLCGVEKCTCFLFSLTCFENRSNFSRKGYITVYYSRQSFPEELLFEVYVHIADKDFQVIFKSQLWEHSVFIFQPQKHQYFFP